MKLLEQCRQVMRLKNYSYRTEQSYVAWIERYIRFHGGTDTQDNHSGGLRRIIPDIEGAARKQTVRARPRPNAAPATVKLASAQFS
jgi:hypothetical protein